MKRLFGEDSSHSEEALNLSDKIFKSIETILEEYKDYDCRDIQNIVTVTAMDAGLSFVLNQRIKK